jgi:hypothetical protein
MVFLEGSAPALPKNFGTSGDVPSVFSAHFSRFRFAATDFSRWANFLSGAGERRWESDF